MPELAEDAELVATELVENALRHTDSAPRLRLELRRRRLSVEVADESPRPAVVREGLDLTETGIGLRMVAKVAKVGEQPAPLRRQDRVGRAAVRLRSASLRGTPVFPLRWNK